MQYSKETLEQLKNNYSRHNASNSLEDEVFDLIEQLENKQEYKKAANVLSIYINFAANKFHSVLLEQDREIVKLLINNNLVSYKKIDDNVLISRITRSGFQSINNYMI